MHATLQQVLSVQWVSIRALEKVFSAVWPTEYVRKTDNLKVPQGDSDSYNWN